MPRTTLKLESFIKIVDGPEELYTNNDMLSKLLLAYEERCLNRKTLGQLF